MYHHKFGRLASRPLQPLRVGAIKRDMCDSRPIWKPGVLVLATALAATIACSSSVTDDASSSTDETTTGEASDSDVNTTIPTPTTGTSTGSGTTDSPSTTVDETSATDGTTNETDDTSATTDEPTTDGSTTGEPVCEDAVEIPDSNFAAALRLELELGDDDTLCASALIQLPATLDLSGWQIEDLTGIEYLDHITDLTVTDNAISDLSPLVALTGLERLILDQNPVSNLATLAAMSNLHEVSVNQTQVSTLVDLAQAQVALIHAQQTAISDLSPVQQMTELQLLDLSDSQVTDLSPLLLAVWFNLTSCAELRFNGCDLNDNSLEGVLLQLCAAGHEVHWDGGVGTCNVEMCFLDP